jgi:hypothetical protein
MQNRHLNGHFYDHTNFIWFWIYSEVWKVNVRDFKYANISNIIPVLYLVQKLPAYMYYHWHASALKIHRIVYVNIFLRANLPHSCNDSELLIFGLPTLRYFPQYRKTTEYIVMVSICIPIILTQFGSYHIVERGSHQTIHSIANILIRSTIRINNAPLFVWKPNRKS